MMPLSIGRQCVAPWWFFSALVPGLSLPQVDLDSCVRPKFPLENVEDGHHPVGTFSHVNVGQEREQALIGTQLFLHSTSWTTPVSSCQRYVEGAP